MQRKFVRVADPVVGVPHQAERTPVTDPARENQAFRLARQDIATRRPRSCPGCGTTSATASCDGGRAPGRWEDRASPFRCRREMRGAAMAAVKRYAVAASGEWFDNEDNVRLPAGEVHAWDPRP